MLLFKGIEQRNSKAQNIQAHARNIEFTDGTDEGIGIFVYLT